MAKPGFPYLLYYDAELVYDQPHIDYRPESGVEERMERVQWRVNEIIKSLESGEPIRNPVMVYIRKSDPTQWKLHPGKCRIKAVTHMGWPTIPAVIVDKTGTYDGPGRKVTVQEASDLYSDDARVIATDDVFNVRCGYKFKGEVLHPRLTVKGPDGVIIQGRS